MASEDPESPLSGDPPAITEPYAIRHSYMSSVEQRIRRAAEMGDTESAKKWIRIFIVDGVRLDPACEGFRSGALAVFVRTLLTKDPTWRNELEWMRSEVQSSADDVRILSALPTEELRRWVVLNYMLSEDERNVAWFNGLDLASAQLWPERYPSFWSFMLVNARGSWQRALETRPNGQH